VNETARPASGAPLSHRGVGLGAGVGRVVRAIVAGLRHVRALGGVALWILAGFIALSGGAILLLAAIVVPCAAVVVALYGLADLFMYVFGVSFRWGLVTACGLLFVVCAVGGLIHDFRLEVTPPEPAERQTVEGPAS